MSHPACLTLAGFILGLCLGLMMGAQRRREIMDKAEDYRFYLGLIRELTAEERTKNIAKEGMKK